MCVPQGLEMASMCPLRSGSGTSHVSSAHAAPCPWSAPASSQTATRFCVRTATTTRTTEPACTRLHPPSQTPAGGTLTLRCTSPLCEADQYLCSNVVTHTKPIEVLLMLVFLYFLMHINQIVNGNCRRCIKTNQCVSERENSP